MPKRELFKRNLIHLFYTCVVFPFTARCVIVFLFLLFSFCIIPFKLNSVLLARHSIQSNNRQIRIIVYALSTIFSVWLLCFTHVHVRFELSTSAHSLLFFVHRFVSCNLCTSTELIVAAGRGLFV